MKAESRLYTFCNMYLSSIQQGIQSAHVVAELFNKYPGNVVSEETMESFVELRKKYLRLRDWAQYHKTIIVLNGGNNQSLNELYQFFDSENNQYPFTCFYEDEQSLGSMMTCIGVILPAKIYKAAELIRQGKSKMIQYRDQYRLASIENGWYNQAIPYSQFEVDLIVKMNQCSLAR